MRFGRHIGVHPDANAYGDTDGVGHGEHNVQLAAGFDVEKSDSGADRLFQLRLGLADARENDCVGVEAGGECAAQLPHRHDVRARAQALQHAQHAQVPIRLDGVTDAMAAALQRVVQRVVLGPNQVDAVDVGGSPDALGNGSQQGGIEP